jgi:hypothetical protein
MKTHWKKLHNPDYFGAYALEPGQELVVTIKSSGVEEVYGENGKKQDCHVIHFVERGVKPMVCNATNAKLITKVVGSPHIDDWVGKKIQLYATEVKAFGDVVEAIRVRPKAPKTANDKPKPELLPDHPKWDDVVDRLGNGATIEAVEQYFVISDQNKEILFEQAAIKFGENQ